MLNWDQSISATTTALNSQGSAMREQEKYNQSLEARVNRLNTAWYNLTNTVGNTILSDSIVVATDLMTAFVDTGEKGSKSLSVLPPILGTLGVGLLLVSTRFRGLVTSIGASTAAMGRASATMWTTSASAQGLAFSLLRVGSAFKGLFTATAVGAVFVGLGIAIEKLTKAYADNVKEQEAFELRQSKNISALTEYKDRTYELIDTYKQLTEAQKDGSNWDINKEQEYLNVQRELGELFPSLVQGISANGEVRLKSIDAIEQEIGVTKELIQAKKDLDIAQSKTTFSDNLNAIGDIYDKINAKKKEFENLDKLNNPKSLAGMTDGGDKYLANLNKLEYEIAELEVKVFESSQEIVGSVLKISDAFSELDLDPSIAKELDTIVASLDFTKMKPDQLVKFSEELGKLQDAMAKASSSGDKLSYDKAVQDLNKLFSTTKNYRGALIETIPTMEEFQKATKLAEESQKLLSQSQEDGERVTTSYEEKIADITEAMYDYKNIAEEMAGVTEASMESTDELLTTYQLLSDRMQGYSDEQLAVISSGKNLSAVEKEVKFAMDQRAEVIRALQTLYPQLANLQAGQISLSRQQVQAINEENNANRILYASYQNVYSGKYTAEQRMTLASVEGTNARIANLNAEIKALSLMVSAYENMYKSFIGPGGTSDPEVAQWMAREANSAKQATARITQLSASVVGLQSNLKTAYKQLDGYNTSIANTTSGSKGSSSSSSSSKSEKDLANYIYQADVYAQSISAINKQLDLQAEYRKTLIEGNELYTDSLIYQKKLEQDKLHTMRLQYTNLEQQIKASKIIDYGRVDANATTDYAEQVAKMNDAKEKLDQLANDIFKQTEAVREIENMWITATTNRFSSQRSDNDKYIELSRAKLANYEKTSREFYNTTNDINQLMKQKQQLNREELDYLNYMLINYDLQNKTIGEVTDRITALKVEMQNLANEIKENNFEVVISVKTQYDDYRSEIQFQIDKLNRLQNQETRGTDAWVRSQQEKIRLQKQESELIKQQIQRMQDEIVKRDLSIDKIKELNKEIQSLTLTYYDAIQAEKDLANELVATQEDVANGIADKLWSAYQSYLSQRRDEVKKALDEESKLEARNHKANMDRLKSELDQFKKNISDRKALLDKQEADRDFDMDMSDMTDERRKVSAELDALSLDNSREAGKRRQQLQAQLDKIDRDMAEKQHDREVSLQKDALDELLKSREESITEEQRIQEELYNLTVDRLDKEKDYWDKYYIDLENDERKYAKLREDIMNNSWDTISNEYQGYIGEMIDTLPLLADSMGGTMEEIGMNIRRNVIDALREAIEVMNEFATKQSLVNAPSTGQYNPGASGSAGGFGTNPTSSSLSASDMKVLMAKYLWESASFSSGIDNMTKSNIQSKAHALAEEGRRAGSNVNEGVALNEYLTRLNKNDLEKLSQFITNNPFFANDPNMEQYLKEFAKRLMLASARLSSGGMIPSGNSGGLDGIGGRSVIVHPEEIISNPIDSKNLLEMNNNMISAFGIIKPLVDKINSFSPGSISTGLTGGLNVVFQVDTMNATQAEAEQFGNVLGDIMTRKFGR